MDVLQIILSKLKRPILAAGRRGMLNWLPDEPYLKLMFRLRIGQKLNLKEPCTFSGKLQWLKLHDRKPEYTQMVDKYEAKKYAASVIGEEYIIPTLGVWERFDDIDFDALPNQFVLKCTHDSGGLAICRDKASFDKKAARTKINRAMRKNYYYHGREWPYKNVKPRIIAEEYISVLGRNDLSDYKLMCFNGKHLCTFTGTQRFSKDGLKITFFDKQWNRMNFERYYPQDPSEIRKPQNYDEMILMAEKIAKDKPFVRVDFYDANGKCYFGEITFYPGSGFEEFRPSTYDKVLGDWLKLSV